MTVFIIGVVTVTALVWILAASLANESDAQKRRIVRDSYSEDEEKPRAASAESRQAA